MLRLKSLLIINGIQMDFCNTVEIKSSWDKHTDTAKIIIPKRIGFKDINGKKILPNIIGGVNPTFKRGDKVEIWLGYEPKLQREFVGFISNVSPKFPIEILCEDLMWNLKQITIQKKFYSNVTLKKLLTDILPSGTPFEALDVNLGAIRISRKTVVEVFSFLNKDYGIETWARDGKIYSGFAYIPALRTDHKFDFNYNVIEDSLNYVRDDDAKFKVKAVSINSKNKKFEIEVGDAGGEQKTFHWYNAPLATLTKLANEALLKLKYEGFRGQFTTFGVPSVKHGDGASLFAPKITEKNGNYLIKSVEKKFGVGIGYRQIIELDRRIL